MKKIYNLLLLGGLLFFGVQTASADYLRGYFDGSWKSTGNFTITGGLNSIEIYLGVGTHWFGLKNGDNSTSSASFEGGDWFGAQDGGTAFTSSDCSDVELKKNGGQCSIEVTTAGKFTFSLEWKNDLPYLTVAYPTSPTTYSAAFTNPNGWTKVYAYAWAVDGANVERKITPEWPGVEVSSPFYILSVESGIAPTKIIWNDGTISNPEEGTNKTAALTYTDDAVYNMTATIGAHTINSTNVTDNYFATFYAPYNVKIPSVDNNGDDITVAAYTGEFNGSNALTLHAIPSPTNVIRGGQAVILRANTSVAYSLAPTAVVGTAGTNDLSGTSSALSVSSLSLTEGETLCVLGIDNGLVGFYGFGGSTLAANKAYMIVPLRAEAPSIRFIIEGENNTTDINNIEAVEEVVKFIENGKLFIKKNGVVYDMMGAVVK